MKKTDFFDLRVSGESNLLEYAGHRNKPSEPCQPRHMLTLPRAHVKNPLLVSVLVKKTDFFDPEETCQKVSGMNSHDCAALAFKISTTY